MFFSGSCAVKKKLLFMCKLKVKTELPMQIAICSHEILALRNFEIFL